MVLMSSDKTFVDNAGKKATKVDKEALKNSIKTKNKALKSNAIVTK